MMVDQEKMVFGKCNDNVLLQQMLCNVVKLGCSSVKTLIAKEADWQGEERLIGVHRLLP